MAANARPSRRAAASASRTGQPAQERDAVDAINEAWAGVNPEFGTVELALSRRAARLFGMLDEVLLSRLAPLKLTRAEFLVVTGLRSVGAPYQLRPTDLTARLLLSSGGTTNVLNSLSKSGFVERVRDANDGRSVWVRLTPAGIDMAEAAMAEWTRAHAEVYRGVPPEVAQAAADALRDLMLALGDHERPVVGAPGPGFASRRKRATRA